MSAASFDEQNHVRIAELGRRVLDGGHLSRAEGQWLFHLENSADIFDLLSWANRIREHFKGNKIHLCSIVNAKAGACSRSEEHTSELQSPSVISYAVFCL